MPPHRRRPVPTTPTTRPRVAGLRKRPEPGTPAPPEQDTEVTPVEDTTAPTVEPTAADRAAAKQADAEPTAARPAAGGDTAGEDAPTNGVAAARKAGSSEPLGSVDHRADAEAEDELADQESAEADRADAVSTEVPGLIEPGEGIAAEDEPATPAPRPRPTGRRKRTGEAVAPSVLTDPGPQHAETADATAWAARHNAAPPTRSALVLPIALVVLAGLLVALGAWFQRQESQVSYNQALVDSAGTTEVAGQTREAVEKAFSYNFADVAATEKAANELLVGKAQCQYNAIFGPVRTLAPEQKLVVTVKAVSSGVTSLDGDRATVLLFLDQVTTRTTDNQTGGGIAMMRVGARKVDGRWKVDNMEMFGQTGDQAAETAKC